MSDSAQQAAARAALSEASRLEGREPRDFAVLEVMRRRRSKTKVPFYYVTLELATGTRLHFQVSDDGRRVEPWGSFQTSRV